MADPTPVTTNLIGRHATRYDSDGRKDGTIVAVHRGLRFELLVLVDGVLREWGAAGVTING